ncbi:MAG: holo-ACP synthase [Candidatus Krumholzibacteria bacterium]|nr:holo-ACP synthase [Candidatus Krumholzibacteria bacterium]
MILGLGIDQCDVRRVQSRLETDPGFAASLFLPAEIAYCTSKRHPAEHFAARFAAKEAVVKALAKAADRGTFWLDIEITHEPGGQPRPVLSGRLGELATGLGVRSIHVSLTHTADMAAAVAIAEG